jgi:hypothetical protein
VAAGAIVLGTLGASLALWNSSQGAGAACADDSGIPTTHELTFAPAAGWKQVDTGANPPAPQTQSAIAANVRIKDPPGVAHADETVQDLPATGIVITASISAPMPSNGASFPERSLPLRLTAADVRHSFEAQPNPDVPEYLLWQRVNGFALDVRVFFGSQDPTASLVAEAQTELERLRVPACRP